MKHKLIYAVKGAEVISERFNIPLADLVDVFADIPSVNESPYDQADIDKAIEDANGNWLAVEALKQLPVKRPKPSKWELKFTGNRWRWVCTNCGKYTKALKDGLPPYCQWCGARMYKEETSNI